MEGLRPRAPLGLVLAAFGAIYFIWGSTYLGIRIAIESLPPFLMAGTRFILAGALLYAWARLRSGSPRPGLKDWRDAAIVGGLLFLGGNGLVVWAEQKVASGPAALIIATEPLWIVLVAMLLPGATRPGARAVLGLIAGFAGVAMLMAPGLGSSAVDPVGAAALVLAALSWAIGSIYSQAAGARARARGNGAVLHAFLWTGMQMLCGGSMQLMAGTARGEWATAHPADMTMRSVLAFLYLVVFGSIVGFTAYSWLLSVCSAASVSTYAYVNPVVAVFLGWLLGGEHVGSMTIIAAAVIIGGVFLILHDQQRAARAARLSTLETAPETG
ncbi:MAG: EamA family transporter [Phycisphaerales bacterium]|nr:EamA family transporter [Phycisphaerales bacterium]